ncbi:MAG: Ldh family oxidoreductase [Bauldia sp.]|nr:Ldh family oxidoreductase [Bauldia sp.]
MAIEHIEGKLGTAEDLTLYVHDLLAAAGADEPSAAAVARSVIDASSRGVDTHGIRLVPWYMQMVEGGRINLNPTVTFERKAPAVGHVDSGDGFGHRASYRAIEEGCAMAAESGIAAITVGRSTHHGATGVYTLAAARKGFAAIGMTHADPAVVPYGGVRAFFGTNPISFAVPAPGEEPILLDMATSAVPYNRVFLRRATGTPLPPEVAVDKDGHFTEDPHAAVALQSLGGGGFGYKGSGLAAMVDILCSAFTGMGHSATMAPFSGPDFSKPIPIGQFFLILNPAAFQALTAFDARIAAFLRDLRNEPGHPGQKVMAPGDPEHAEARRRRENGIPVDRVTWKALGESAEKYGVAVPKVADTADATTREDGA